MKTMFKYPTVTYFLNVYTDAYFEVNLVPVEMHHEMKKKTI